MTRMKTVVMAAALGLCSGLIAHAGPADSGPAGVVRWELELDGRKIVLASPIGEMAEVTRQDGSVIGLVPVLAPDGSVRFKVLDLTTSRGEEKHARQVDELDARPGEAAFSKTQTDFSLTLLRADGEHAGAAAPALGLPASEKIIRFNLAMPDGHTVQLAVQEGETARVGIDGQWYGIVPRVRDLAAGSVAVRIYSLSKTAGPRMLGDFDLEAGTEHLLSSLGGTRVLLAGLEEAPKPDLKSAAAALQEGPGGGEVLDGCCVRCGGTEACGCSVDMDCGSCCSPPCCRIIY